MFSSMRERVNDRGFPWNFLRFLARRELHTVLNSYVAGPVAFQSMRVAIKLGLFEAKRSVCASAASTKHRETCSPHSRRNPYSL